MSNYSLQGKTALITGASRGLGKSIAQTYWQAGANLYLIARSADTLAEVADSLNKKKYCSKQEVIVISGDLSDESFLESIPSVIQKESAQLDILVNNAAIHGPIGPVSENDWTMWKHTFEIDFFAPVFLSRQLLPLLKKSIRGKIINISGGGATQARANFSAYGLAKTALVRFTELLALEITNIDINAIAPGVMNTDLLAEILQYERNRVGNQEYDNALNIINNNVSDESLRLATKLSLFLASQSSDGITGRLISARWDDWENLPQHLNELIKSDIYTLRRIVPKDRNRDWGDV